MRRDVVRRSGAGSAQCRVGGEVHGQHQPYGRQWGLEVFEGAGLGEIGEDPTQVMTGLEATGPGGLDEAIRLAEAWAPATVPWKSQWRRL